MPKYVAKPALQSRTIATPKIPTLISNFQVSQPSVSSHPFKSQAGPRAAASSQSNPAVKKKGCSCSKYAK